MSYAMAEPGSFVESRRGQSAVMPVDILASVQIETEIARVLHALTAWLQFPEVDRIECHAERGSDHRFLIDLLSSGTRNRRISASRFISMPNKIKYVFERSQPGRGGESIAEVRLCSRQGICSLDLRHTGLCAHDERTWYSTAWHYSLNRLSKLVEVRRGDSPALRQ
jgi:hypothetical protein